MSEHKTLLQFLLDLLHDKQAMADFQDDPKGELHAAGLDHVCVQDIQDLLPVVLEKEDPEKAARYEDDCDHDKCHDDGPKHHGHDGHRDSDHDHDDDHRWQHDHDNEIDKVVTHLNYVVNNYSVDSHDTIYNTNNITKVWADHGAKVDVTNDTHNVGAGGVSIEGNNSAPITTGHGNVVGDGNQIADHGANAAFGAGSTALSNVGANDGGAINTGAGGSASGTHTDAHLNAFGGGTVQNGTGNVATDDHTNNSVHDSNNTTDNSHGSHNTDNSVKTDLSNHDSGNTQTDTDLSNHDSGNTFSATDDSNHLNVHDNHVDLHPVHP